MNFYKHHIGDFDADTAHLSWLEDAAYRRLMCLYYRREAPIPADIAQACRLVRATSRAEREAVESVLREFFEMREDGWHNKRCDVEIEAATLKAARNREVGKRGGRPPKPRTQEEPNENPDGFHAETKKKPTGNPSQTPDSRHQKEKPPKPPRGGSERGFPPGFEEFWAAYPKKVGKDAAARAFAKRKVDFSLMASMLGAIKVQRESEQWRKDGGQFIPNPATWLNAGRWQDEIATPERSAMAAIFDGAH